MSYADAHLRYLLSLQKDTIKQIKEHGGIRKTVVVSAKRTRLEFGGVFKDISAVKLAVTVAKPFSPRPV